MHTAILIYFYRGINNETVGSAIPTVLRQVVLQLSKGLVYSNVCLSYDAPLKQAVPGLVRCVEVIAPQSIRGS